MSKFWKKLTAVTMAAAMSFSFYSVMPRYETSALELGTYEAEELTLDGCTVWTSIYDKQFPGYSGDGFVYQTGGTITMEIEAPEDGMYEISCRFVQILDEAGRMQTVEVNGSKYMKQIPYADTWTDFSFGRFRLNQGTNTIVFRPEYGYAAYDTITIKEAVLPELTGNTEPCDPNATEETKALLQYLASVYGDHILSGQQEIYGGGHDTDPDGYEKEFEYLNNLTGEYPAIRGFDLMNYNPLYGWDDGSTERLIEWVTERNGIATVCWHLNLPTDFTSYEVGTALDWQQCSYKNNSTFSVANAVVEGTKENEFFNLCIEDLAEQLLRAQDAGAPIMFRPFHEAEGNGGLDGSGAWFWWAQDGVEAYKALWQYLYTELTETYGLHNLIWVQNLYAWSEDSAQWYVGDDYVDIVGYDKYNTTYNRHDGLTSGPNLDAESGLFYSLYDYVDGRKMVAMPENDTVPSLSNMQIEKAGWLYFCIWYDNGTDNFVSGSNYQDPDELTTLYQSDYCITLDELPEDLYILGEVEPTEPTETESGTETTGVAVQCGDIDGDNTISLIDVIALCQCLMGADSLSNYYDNVNTAADANVDGIINSSDVLIIVQYLVKVVDELPIIYIN